MNVFFWSEIQIQTFFFVMLRVTSLMLFLPILGDRSIPPVIKILFGLSFSFVVFPLLWAKGVRIDPSLFHSVSKSVLAVASDAIFGMMVGFVARWIFDAVQFAGHFAGTSIGFSMPSVLDPHSETQNVALTELQYVLIAMLFLTLDGHLIYLQTILQSFSIVPVGGVDLFANNKEVTDYLIAMTAEVLVLGVKLCAPVLVVIFVLNLAFATISRAVPQMNVLAVSFSANIVVGLLVALVTLPGFMNMVSGAFESYTSELLRFMRLFRG